MKINTNDEDTNDRPRCHSWISERRLFWNEKGEREENKGRRDEKERKRKEEKERLKGWRMLPVGG